MSGFALAALIALAASALLLPRTATAGKEQINAAAAAGEEVLVSQTRRIPGKPPPAKEPLPEIDPDKVPPPAPHLPREFLPIPDRWRLADAVGVTARWWDPYNQNVLKADRPVFGRDYFVNLAAISDTVYEPRRVPTARSGSGTSRPGANDQFADGDQLLLVENVILSASLIKGDTAYKPPDFELRLTPVIQVNYATVDEAGVLKRDTRSGIHRYDHHAALQEGFVDVHLRNVSDRYDFDSIRVGIQPFSSDFRGFLFQDNQLGIRLFGNRDNNVFQYNLAWFHRLDKDTNSGLNDVARRPRDDDVIIGNLYVQDFPAIGFTSQVTVVHNRNRENDRFINDNDFQERPAPLGDQRPRDYYVTYLGYNGDGHFGRANLTVSAYYAFGRDSHNQLNDSLEGERSDISAFFLAMEPSIDFDWARLRGSLLYASADRNPFDDKETGFDAIFENPQFAGGDTSFWIRQGVPLIGGGGVALTQRNGVLASLRTSKEHGQSNFNNPGLILAGVGADFDLLPELRLSTNVNGLWFADTTILETLRNQGEISNEIGYDLSAALTWRPFMTQNVVLRLSGAMFIAGMGFKDLFVSTADPRGFGKEVYYSVLGNFILTY
jgi:hypothetical protein